MWPGRRVGVAGLVISYDASMHHDLRLAAGATIVVAVTAVFATVALGSFAWRSRVVGTVQHGGGEPQ